MTRVITFRQTSAVLELQCNVKIKLPLCFAKSHIIKLSLYLTKYHAVKTYWGVEV